ncbi:MAG: hypothetical protein US69_C0001G0003 [candidate division TM6 bacterium GW2011_GWF2_38_10]|nr:MAG: hypothetical protein US69_C0001G0003 [candidate division TM6 bacterium GW2011_GWF2_38_10]
MYNHLPWNNLWMLYYPCSHPTSRNTKINAIEEKDFSELARLIPQSFYTNYTNRNQPPIMSTLINPIYKRLFNNGKTAVHIIFENFEELNLDDETIQRINPNVTDNDGRTPLFYLVQNVIQNYPNIETTYKKPKEDEDKKNLLKKILLIRKITKWGGDIHLEDQYGESPLSLVQKTNSQKLLAWITAQEVFEKIINALQKRDLTQARLVIEAIDNNDLLSTTFSQTDYYNRTILHWAIIANDAAFIDEILQKAKSTNKSLYKNLQQKQDICKLTPIDLAIIQHNHEIVARLKNEDFPLNNNFLETTTTPISQALIYLSYKAAEYRVREYGAEENIKTQFQTIMSNLNQIMQTYKLTLSTLSALINKDPILNGILIEYAQTFPEGAARNRQNLPAYVTTKIPSAHADLFPIYNLFYYDVLNIAHMTQRGISITFFNTVFENYRYKSLKMLAAFPNLFPVSKQAESTELLFTEEPVSLALINHEYILAQEFLKRRQRLDSTYKIDYYDFIKIIPLGPSGPQTNAKLVPGLWLAMITQQEKMLMLMIDQQPQEQDTIIFEDRIFQPFSLMRNDILKYTNPDIFNLLWEKNPKLQEKPNYIGQEIKRRFRDYFRPQEEIYKDLFLNALKKNQHHIVKKIRETYGTPETVTIPSGHEISLLGYIIRESSHINAKNLINELFSQENGITPTTTTNTQSIIGTQINESINELFAAVFLNNFDITQRLMKKNEFLRIDTLNVLHFAALHSNNQKMLQTITSLPNTSQLLQEVYNYSDETITIENATPLHLAVYKENLEACRELIQQNREIINYPCTKIKLGETIELENATPLHLVLVRNNMIFIDKFFALTNQLAQANGLCTLSVQNDSTKYSIENAHILHVAATLTDNNPELNEKQKIQIYKRFGIFYHINKNALCNITYENQNKKITLYNATPLHAAILFNNRYQIFALLNNEFYLPNHIVNINDNRCVYKYSNTTIPETTPLFLALRLKNEYAAIQILEKYANIPNYEIDTPILSYFNKHNNAQELAQENFGERSIVAALINEGIMLSSNR